MATTITKETLQPQQGTSSSSMAEDESSKRNTDCVYFLASPLTCKKGNECEYRHSEYARINPRDCWYWMNGNCLNPKCSFRHPPLDGLVSPQSGNFAGPPALVQPGQPVPASPQNPTKQGVPCIFFQKGYCLKGDRCPFMHGPNPPSAKMQLVPASIAASEAPAFKKNFGTLEKCTQPKMNSNVNTPKVVKAPPQPKVIPPKGQSSRPVNGEPSGRGYQPPRVVIEEAPKYEEMKPSSVDNGRSRSGRALHGGSYDDQSFQNGRDADDSLRESSPGFDVLVDDKLSEDEYYHNDQYSRIRGHDRRNPKEFDLGHQDDRNPAADVDSEIYHNRRGYDPFDRVPDKYGWDHRRASSERSLGEPAHYDRRGPYKSESPDLNQNSDLRHRLSKQRRVNGLKSVVNSDYGFDDHHSEDRGYRSAQRDSRQSPIHETSRGNRLHGRIKLPRRTSPMNDGNDMHPDRETERGRNWGRSSPSRQQVSGQQGRLRDRLSGRILDESREGRRINGPMARQDAIAGADFAAPKRLSELRGSQQSDSKQQQLKSQQSVAGGKLRDTVLASSIATEGDLSFEGPKPLSEILKRKRTAPTGINSDDKEEIKLNENSVYSAANSGKHLTLTSAIVQDEVGEVYSKPPTIEADEEEGEILNKKTKLDGEGEYTLPEPDDHKHPEAEEGLAAVDGEEPEYDEEYDHGEDGDYDYEQVDGEGFNLNEGETGDHEVDSMDEDDGDDFAKKLGVSF